jgi:hypothetical protein
MSRRVLAVALGLFAVVLLIGLPTGIAVSREMLDVVVNNWPQIQQVDGTVKVEGPIRNAELVSFENITVAPIKRHQTTRFIEAGTLTTDGYPYVVLSVSGVVKGEVLKPGKVGVLLLPVQEKVDAAFNERGQFMFPLEVTSKSVDHGDPYFDSPQPRFTVGFPEYRVFLYNTSEKSVLVDVFAYLTN